MLWAILGILAACLAFDFLMRCVACAVIVPMLERSPPFGVEPTAPDPDAESVEFATADGLTLRGSLHWPHDRAPAGLVVFCPELGGDHWSASWYCAPLFEAGFAVLSFDFRNQGRSDRQRGYAPLHWLTDYEVADVHAALKYGRERPELSGLPIGLFGISRGGCAALVAAAQSPDVCCVAVEGVFSILGMSLHYTFRWASLYVPGWLIRMFPVWHVRSTLAMARWVSQFHRRCRYTRLDDWLPRLAGRPTLMIIDGRDTYVLPEISESLYQRIPESSRSRWIVAAAKHNMARDVDRDGYDRRIAAFFSQMDARPPQSAGKPYGGNGIQHPQHDDHVSS